MILGTQSITAIRNQNLVQALCWALAAGLTGAALSAPYNLTPALLYLPVMLIGLQLRGRFFRGSLLAVGVVGILAPLLPGAFTGHPGGEEPLWGQRLIIAGTLGLLFFLARRPVDRELHAAQLLLSKRRRKVLFDLLGRHLPLKTWSADASGSLEHVSASLVDYTGVSEETLLQDWPSTLHPADRPRVLSSWLQALDTGTPYSEQFRFRRHDGAYLWHKARATPIIDEETGESTAWLGSSYDIDDLVRMRNRANEMSELFRHTIDSITDAFLTLDEDLRVTYINRKAEDIFQAANGSLLGSALLDRLHCRAGLKLAEEIKRCKGAQSESHFEFRYPEQGPWLDVRIYPSNPGLTIYLLDITENKEETKQLSLLSNAVARLNDIVLITEASPLDEPGPTIVFVNDAFERITGYSRAEAIGQSPRFLQGPNTSRHELDRIRRALEHQQPVRSQIINYTKTGEEFCLELDIAPVADSGQKPTHMIAVERDITTQKKLEDQLVVSQRMESIGRLTGGVAHDFNNLLGVIMANAELLQTGLEAHEIWDLSEMVDLIIQASERGAALTQNMLAFARRQPLDPKTTDLAALLSELLPILRSSAGELNQLSLYAPNELWPVNIDIAQMENSLINLALNARDAMPGGGSIAIHLDNCTVSEQQAESMPGLKPGDYVCLQFSDTGTGMSPETLNRAFEPFYTTKEERGGYGLGLSTVYGFIKQSDGYVRVSSNVGEGTVFELFFPKASGDFQKQQPIRKAARNGPSEQPKDRTILLVEDNPDLQKVTQIAIRSAGYQVLTCSNADQALEYLESGESIDLVVSDVVMPGEYSGIDLAEYIAQKFPTRPVILTSGFSELTTVAGDERWKQFPLLRKPYRPRELLTLIGEKLSESAMKNERN